ncbi:unnamed protein product, partial [Closterium sp. Yama58-4]
PASLPPSKLLDKMSKRPHEGNGDDQPKPRYPPSACFIAKLKKMFEAEKFTDVTFEASDGTKVAAHRSVIAQWSPVLEALFDTSLLENEKGSVLKLNDMDAGTLKLLVSFMYGCTVVLPEENRKAHGFSLLQAAHKYNVPELVHEMDRQLSALPVEEETLLKDMKFVDTLGALRTRHAPIRHFVYEMGDEESKKLIKDMIESDDKHDRTLASSIVSELWSR